MSAVDVVVVVATVIVAVAVVVAAAAAASTVADVATDFFFFLFFSLSQRQVLPNMCVPCGWVLLIRETAVLTGCEDGVPFASHYHRVCLVATVIL